MASHPSRAARVVLCVAAAASAGCATRPTAHFALATPRGRVHVGMTAAELVRTLGRPTEAMTRELRSPGDAGRASLTQGFAAMPGDVDRAVDAHLAAHRQAMATPPPDADALVNLTLRSVGHSDVWVWRYFDHTLRAWVCDGCVATLETSPGR